MEFALDRWITKHNAWIDVFGPNYMRWIFRDVKMTILFLGQFLFGKVLQVFKEGVLLALIVSVGVGPPLCSRTQSGGKHICRRFSSDVWQEI